MEHADDLVERAAVHRVARVRRVDDGSRAHPRAACRPRSPPPRVAAPSPPTPPSRRSRRPCRASPPRPPELPHVLGRAPRCGGCPRACTRSSRPAPGSRAAAGARRSTRPAAARRSETRPAEHVERSGQDRGEPLRLLQRDRLGHELAEDDRDVREESEREDEARRRERRLDQLGDKGSPTAPTRIANTVIPSCVADEAHGLVHQAKGDAGAGPPLCARSSRRARRAVMSEYSAATNTASRGRAEEITTRRTSLMAREGRRTLGGIWSPIDQAAV